MLTLEAVLIFGEEFLKVMEEHPVEDSAFWMTLTIDPCHGRDIGALNGPEDWGKLLRLGSPGMHWLWVSLFFLNCKQNMTFLKML